MSATTTPQAVTGIANGILVRGVLKGIQGKMALIATSTTVVVVPVKSLRKVA